MPHYVNRTVLSTTASLFVETWVRVNKYANKGADLLKFITQLLKESSSCVSSAHFTLLVSSLLKYAKLRNIVGSDDLEFKTEFTQSFC